MIHHSKMRDYRFLVVDDIGLTLKRWVAIINQRFPRAEVLQADNADDAVAEISLGGLDLVVTDLFMPDQKSHLTIKEGLRVLDAAQEQDPPIPVLVVSQLETDEAYIKLTNYRNLRGFIPMSQVRTGEEIAEAIITILKGDPAFAPAIGRRLWGTQKPDDARLKDALLDDRFVDGESPKLSPRQNQVFELIGHGLMSSPDIALQIGVTTPWVDRIVSELLEKFGLKNRDQLRWEWIRLNSPDW